MNRSGGSGGVAREDSRTQQTSFQTLASLVSTCVTGSLSPCLAGPLSLWTTGDPQLPERCGAALRCKSHVQDLGSQTDELEPVTSLPCASVSSLVGQMHVAISGDDGENSMRELDNMPTQSRCSAEDKEPRGPGK